MAAGQVLVDFHQAPEAGWQQRYIQLSPGGLRSRLARRATTQMQVFGKWMSGRVVQQGVVPAGQVCFARLGDCAGASVPHAQGREFTADSLLVLGAGQEFMFQRPAGMEMLSLSLRQAAFDNWLDAALPARQLLQASPLALARLRRRLRGALQGATNPPALVEALAEVLHEAGDAAQTVRSASAAYLVAQCHRLVAASGSQPPDIEALVRTLRTSRRTLQNSFRAVTGTTAVDYLRGLRLNLVRRRLQDTVPGQLSVSMAAASQGFEQLSHFSARYAALFSELPSRTRRALSSPPGP